MAVDDLIDGRLRSYVRLPTYEHPPFGEVKHLIFTPKGDKLYARQHTTQSMKEGIDYKVFAVTSYERLLAIIQKRDIDEDAYHTKAGRKYYKQKQLENGRRMQPFETIHLVATQEANQKRKKNAKTRTA